MSENKERKNGRLPSRVFIVGSLTQFAQGMYAPFLSTYLIDMGANYAELSAFRSVGNFAPTMLQPIWGTGSDKVGRTKPFVVFGILTGLFTVFLFLWAATPIDMIILYGIQSVLLSIQIPTWLSLIGGMMDEDNRGEELGKLSIATNSAALSATLISGFIAGVPAILPFLRASLGDLGPILFPPVETWREIYYIPFYITAIVGIIASILAATIKEKPRDLANRRELPPIHKLLSQPGDFRRLCAVATFFSFGMSMAWPYFSVVQRVWLHNTLFEIGLASAIMAITTVIFTGPLGRLSDRVGRKPLILVGRGTLFIVPIIYAFATTTIMIYIANAVAGFAIAGAFNALTAYIYDIAPEEERGSYLSVYNTFTGIIFLGGSLLAGILGQALVPIVGDHDAAFAMLILSGVLRFFAAFLFIFLHEPRQYASTMRAEILSRLGRRIRSDNV
ncbi:MAG: MFS transporter [Candidatus Thorarchaeota archaeon]|nr:MFS transporter [Candidatus Thorarchaeota archaeon]